jgi:2,4-diaminopentanoate dehydrogenase
VSPAPLRVAFYGAGQVAANASEILRDRTGIEVVGAFGRGERAAALGSGVDVVVIATTSFLRDVADDIETAIQAGSNVITTAEEAAFPWAEHAAIAARIDLVARDRNVSVLGTGLNPGFAFDALVLTVTGICATVRALRVERVVDLSGFGTAVSRRIGIGFAAGEFAEGCRSGRITGHMGFPQSMRIVASALGVSIDRIDRTIEPIFARETIETASMRIEPGATAGFRQRYVAHVGDSVWFEASFIGHVAPLLEGLETRDEIAIDATPPVTVVTSPGMNSQSGSAAVIANSVRRIAAAPAGWLTVADLPPAIAR